MAFTKQTIFDAITIRATGNFEIRMAKLVLEDGVEIARNYDRRVISPADNITNEPAKIQQLAAVIWTPAMIAAAKAIADSGAGAA